jgi:hypothetical protein
LTPDLQKNNHRGTENTEKKEKRMEGGKKRLITETLCQSGYGAEWDARSRKKKKMKEMKEMKE